MSDEATMILPQDMEAERHVLWGIMSRDDVFAEVSLILKVEDFASFAHQCIFSASAALIADGKPIEGGLLIAELNAKDRMKDVTLGYLTDIADNAWSSYSASHYAEIVADKAKLRSLIRAGEDLARMARGPGAISKDALAEAERVIFDLSRENDRNKTLPWQTCLDEANDVLDRRAGRAKDGETDEGLMTGWPTLDKLTGGLHKRELIVLAARPGGGKTLAALNIIDTVASERGNVFFASLEQGRVEVVHRVLSKRSGVNSHRFRTGKFDADDDLRLTNAISAVKPHKVWINDGSGQSLAGVMSESRRLKMRHGLDLVVVDYLGLMDSERSRYTANRNQEIGQLTRGLKRLAKDLDVTVLCLAQLNRGSENRTDRRPRLSDLRDSGEIEQDADAVFMLHKPEEKDHKRETDLLDFLIEKQRNGPCGEVKMIHYKRTFEIKEARGGLL